MPGKSGNSFYIKVEILKMKRATSVFVIRIWGEYLKRETPTLVGEVEDLDNHEKFPFKDSHELGRLIEDHCKKDINTEKSGENEPEG